MPLKPDHTGQSENLFALLRHAVLDGAGSTPPRVRHAVAYATPQELADELRDYVVTLREHAYRATDSQVAALLAAGWSEDQVYELTVAAALGAGQHRLDTGLAALASYRESQPLSQPPSPPAQQATDQPPRAAWQGQHAAPETPQPPQDAWQGKHASPPAARDGHPAGPQAPQSWHGQAVSGRHPAGPPAPSDWRDDSGQWQSDQALPQRPTGALGGQQGVR